MTTPDDFQQHLDQATKSVKATETIAEVLGHKHLSVSDAPVVAMQWLAAKYGDLQITHTKNYGWEVSSEAIGSSDYWDGCLDRTLLGCLAAAVLRSAE